MRITVVGAALVVAVIIVAVLVIRALAEKRNGGSETKQSDHGTES